MNAEAKRRNESPDTKRRDAHRARTNDTPLAGDRRDLGVRVSEAPHPRVAAYDAVRRVGVDGGVAPAKVTNQRALITPGAISCTGVHSDRGNDIFFPRGASRGKDER